ncbi:MAG: hypothetical protein P3X22_000170 [Thermoprotei archaeon]|nr:hypothetical protein [Thermoprotei archaeon]
MKLTLYRLTPVALRLIPIILAFILLTLGAAEAGGPKGPPDWDPF